jgi:hypothetical protein
MPRDVKEMYKAWLCLFITEPSVNHSKQLINVAIGTAGTLFKRLRLKNFMLKNQFYAHTN